MFVVIAYDIEDDGLRNRISKILVGFGQRVQKSVFECRVPKAAYDSLTKQLKRVIKDDKEGANIRIYHLCQKCRANAVGVGKTPINRAQNEGFFLY